MKRFLLTFCILIFSLTRFYSQEYRTLEDKTGLSGISATNGIENPVTVSIIYDNYVSQSGLKSDWGFSVLISGLNKTVLFDTGTNPDIFVSNFKKMNLDPGAVNYLVLSHEHGDHIGGIPGFVKMRSDIPVIFPHSFSNKFKKSMKDLNLEPVLVDKPAAICDNLYTSGVFDYQIPEHSLVLNTKLGLVVITGCSHPGIIRMLSEIKSKFGKNIYMVFGGFHLLQKSDKEMESIIRDLKELGVVKCGATHCTGDHQIQMIREAYGNDFIEMGVGNTLVIN
jgi:7,8-dihydropterin-6-yl-methyl-4-(beta-D-ribofuranosyl)aminobenzene 5'-phosphate synthase